MFNLYAKEPSFIEKTRLVFDAIKMHFLPSRVEDINEVLNVLTLPKGFNITLYASGVAGARSLTLGKNGVVFVGTRGHGAIYAILPKVKPNGLRDVITLARGLNLPNGIAFFEGDLYVAENHRLLKFSQVMTQLAQGKTKAEVIYDKLPENSHHGWRYLAAGPDNKLYISIGAPCNICLNDDKQFASIVRLNRDGTDFEIFAQGIRNSVGFTFHPQTKALWFTDNGRDWLGDDLPPDELNFAPIKGMYFGFPFVYGNNIADEFYDERPNSTLTPPVYGFQAHVAALGLRFYDQSSFPRAYQNNLFVALHGSWNRSEKVGYKIMHLKVKDHKVIRAENFITGWLQGQNVLGRPVDVLVMPDGNLLVSDDYNGVVYRVSYVGQ